MDAHEVSHIKAKDINRLRWDEGGGAWLTQRLMAALGGFSLAAVFCGSNTGLLLIAGGAAVLGLREGQKLLSAFNSRSMERRRDYEAVLLTGDIEAAKGTINKLERYKNVKDYSLKERWFSTHPLGSARIANMEQAYTDGLRSGAINPGKRLEPAPF